MHNNMPATFLVMHGAASQEGHPRGIGDQPLALHTLECLAGRSFCVNQFRGTVAQTIQCLALRLQAIKRGNGAFGTVNYGSCQYYSKSDGLYKSQVFPRDTVAALATGDPDYPGALSDVAGNATHASPVDVRVYT